MKKIPVALAVLLFVVPSVSFAAALTPQQSSSLIAVVQSSPGTPASAFVSLITAFSNITVNQATSLITVVQAAPGVPANAFINLLTSFTVDAAVTQPAAPVVATPAVTTQTTQTNQQVSSLQNQQTQTTTTNSVASTAQVPSPSASNYKLIVLTKFVNEVSYENTKQYDAPDAMSVQAGIGKLTFLLRTYGQGNVFEKVPVTITTDDPDLPSSFALNATQSDSAASNGVVGTTDFFCVAPPAPGATVLNGCSNENPVSVGTFNFIFSAKDFSRTIRVTITPSPSISVTSDKTQILANGDDPAVILVKMLNSDGTPIAGKAVTKYGTELTYYTNASGIASFVVTTTQKGSLDVGVSVDGRIYHTNINAI